ncbi:ogr/Delta-like zinc finger family protein [Salmonella enterica]|nr:ogr/Delta-like zinc finger family protein [Salmonella enterica subsp. enterica serovar Chandans]EGL4347724.1 ogr/Delta-like zinc finger family protein [Salmonella enterica]EGL4358111.1 ogr/Delta-like zinc finger family protein [Salmonella enterica]EGL4380935.1 ogr/Delta-like zinc finger family protein [Salmonella enterica]EGL4487562.1 ogr/Delta-like zinc finger family protein [Salmonella enterica]
MFRCPLCGASGNTRTSNYFSKNVKKTWYVCANPDCMCAYTTLESFDRVLTRRVPGTTDIKTRHEAIKNE